MTCSWGSELESVLARKTSLLQRGQVSWDSNRLVKTDFTGTNKVRIRKKPEMCIKKDTEGTASIELSWETMYKFRWEISRDFLFLKLHLVTSTSFSEDFVQFFIVVTFAVFKDKFSGEIHCSCSGGKMFFIYQLQLTTCAGLSIQCSWTCSCLLLWWNFVFCEILIALSLLCSSWESHFCL